MLGFSVYKGLLSRAYYVLEVCHAFPFKTSTAVENLESGYECILSRAGF